MERNMIPFARVLKYGNIVEPENTAIKKVACGQTHYCVLLENGKAYGIGYNNSKQLKDCTALYQYGSFVLLAEDVVDLWCGNVSTILYLKDGRYIFNGNYNCMGTKAADTLSTQEGDDITSSMPLYSTVKMMDIGVYQMHYLDNNGAVYGRGRNINGTVGDGTRNVIGAFKLVKSAIVDLYSGEFSSIFADADRLYGCGVSNYGELGKPTTANNAIVQILTNTRPNFIGTRSSTISYYASNTAAGTGWELHGALGNGVSTNTTKTAFSVYNIPGSGILKGARLRDGGSVRSLYLGADRKVYSTGLDSYNGLGVTSSTFVAVPGLSALDFSDESKVLITGGQVFGLIFDGTTLYGIGSYSFLPGKPLDNSLVKTFSKVETPK